MSSISLSRRLSVSVENLPVWHTIILGSQRNLTKALLWKEVAAISVGDVSPKVALRSAVYAYAFYYPVKIE